MKKKTKNQQNLIPVNKKPCPKKNALIGRIKEKLLLYIFSYIWKKLCPFSEIIELAELIKEYVSEWFN